MWFRDEKRACRGHANARILVLEQRYKKVSGFRAFLIKDLHTLIGPPDPVGLHLLSLQEQAEVMKLRALDNGVDRVNDLLIHHVLDKRYRPADV